MKTKSRILEDISDKARWYITFGNDAPWENKLAIRLPEIVARWLLWANV